MVKMTQNRLDFEQSIYTVAVRADAPVGPAVPRPHRRRAVARGAGVHRFRPGRTGGHPSAEP